MTAATPPAGLSEPAYEAWARGEVEHWRRRMLKPATRLDRMAGAVQVRINRIIPEKVHAVVTDVIERMTRAILVGADATTFSAPLKDAPLSLRDRKARSAILGYRATAAAEGGVTGAGGFWLSAADFPALVVIKLKLLFELAAIYGHSGELFAERLYILHLFELAFSGADHRAAVLDTLEDWDARRHPETFETFDWRTFQMEYRDYIDLPKMAQMVPLIGAPVGAVVNWRLLDRLGDTAVNGYRTRWLERPA
ncbi:EcsC family protein [Phenylobacterium sp.]|uniref:EcsC family protein n=1 Tax=Phenylobacterium sp. TaxID=1871053 RepID=UPI00356400D4